MPEETLSFTAAEAKLLEEEAHIARESLMKNFGFALVRATESTALTAGRWIGLGKRVEADRTATETMADALNRIDMIGHIVVAEDRKLGEHSLLKTGQTVGSGHGPTMDIVVDAVDGVSLLVEGRPGAISTVCAAPRGSMWTPAPARYMEKIVVDREVAAALVPECMEAPAAWTLALIARVQKKSVRDLVVFVLDRPRHHNLIEEIRRAGARVLVHYDGDVAGALLAALPRSKVDVLMGVGGASEGVLAAAAVRALGGAMLARLAPQSDEERRICSEQGIDTRCVRTCSEIVASQEIYFAATGITDGMLLSGVSYQGPRAETHSLIIRGQTGVRRMIHTEHVLEFIR